MNRCIRAGLLLLAATAAAGLYLKRSGFWQRFKDQQFAGDEVKPTGRLASAYGAAAPWLNAWLYAIFSRNLGLGSEDEVLDVACGSGAFLRKHGAHARRIAGLDHSEDLIDIALRTNRERVAAGTAEFVVGDATVLPWPDGHFTVVTSNCLNCFEAKATQALAEMYRVLRPGGRAVVADDRQQAMEAVGFDRVSTERILWGHLTTGFKD